MREHDVAEIKDYGTGDVVVVCSCGHRSAAPSRAQALKKHGAHFDIERAREALRRGRARR